MMQRPSANTLTGDIFGGLAAMLVALPSAIAFGMIIFGPLGAASSGKAAMAGILGTVALGLVAPVFGGAPRLVTAPCAPAAAVLSVFVMNLLDRSALNADVIPVYVGLTVFAAGLVQFIVGNLGGGRFIKYIPYPVVAGYLSGVGVLIFLGQLPKLLGLAKDVPLSKGVWMLSAWHWPSLGVGLATIAVMVAAPRIIRAVPAAIVALTAGIGMYFVLAIFDPSMASLENNPMVIGPISGSLSQLAASLSGQWSMMTAASPGQMAALIVPLFTLAVLLSIDTLKTCVVMDALTQSRHDSNKELIAQGLANMAAAAVGGIPGAGTMGATLVNLNSGAKTRFSGVWVGIFAVLVLLFLSKLVAWIPLAALAGVLIVVAVRMLDVHSLHLLRHKSTVLDFFVILAVIVSAVSMSLIMAAGVGIAMAILLFLREQIRASVIRRKFFGNQTFSKKKRLADELAILHVEGKKTVIFELQGQLFFGTTDQLLSEVEPYYATCRHIVLNMRRVQSLDFTAAQMLKNIHNRLKEKQGHLILVSLPLALPTGQSIKDYLEMLGFSETGMNLKFFPDIDSALSWIEEQVLAATLPSGQADKPLSLGEFAFFAGVSDQALANLEACLQVQSVKADAPVFRQADVSDDIYFIRKGAVRIVLPLGGGMVHHLATFGRGDFFGDMAFLDKAPRSANAIAETDTDLFILSRTTFAQIAAAHPEVAGIFFERLALALAQRLRQTDIELMALQES